MTNVKTTATANSSETVELAPNYRIPVVLVLIAIPLALISKIAAIVILLFGIFLMFQTKNIRLQFTPTALDVYSSRKMIRSFPYKAWSNWQIFWQPVPILFYFREVNSIHFLPIIFDAKALVSCLEKHCPKT